MGLLVTGEFEAIRPLLPVFQIVLSTLVGEAAVSPGYIGADAGELAVRRGQVGAPRFVPPTVAQGHDGVSGGEVPAPNPSAAGRYQMFAVGSERQGSSPVNATMAE